MNDKKRKLQENISKGVGDVPEAATKLTKQQKRDAKRNGNKLLEMSSAPSVAVETLGLTTVNKASVYKRLPNLPPASPFPLLHVDRFLIPADKNFQKVLETCYDGFVLDEPKCFPDEFHESFQSSFTSIEKLGVFQFDLTQPAGLGTKVIANLSGTATQKSLIDVLSYLIYSVRAGGEDFRDEVPGRRARNNIQVFRYAKCSKRFDFFPS
jgi:FTO catalytic domain